MRSTINVNRSLVRAGLRAARPLFRSRWLGVCGRRFLLEVLTAAARPPKGTRFERTTIAGVPVVRVLPVGTTPGGTLIYLHGGAYSLGSAWGYRGLAAHLAQAAGMTALLPDYSRAPGARYPVALEEMTRVYRQLLNDGLDPEKIVLAGDSAGGGLAMALAMALRDDGVAQPAAIGLICPWADLASDVEATRPALRDPLIIPEIAAEWAPRYTGSEDPRLPGISPVYGDMAGLPPIIMQSAGDDPIAVDANRIEAAVAATPHGVIAHRQFDGLWHDFQLQVSLLVEARNAVLDFGTDLRSRVDTKVPRHSPNKGPAV